MPRPPGSGRESSEVTVTRFACITFWLIGLLAVVPSRAAPQSGAAGGAVDSLRHEPILDRLRFHPNYSSSYTVNRSSRQWDQQLSADRTLGSLRLTNQWGLTQRRDKAQSNLRSKRGQMNFNANYDLGHEGLWTVGLDGAFNRDAQLSTRSDQVENRSDLALTLGTNIPQRAMRRLSLLKPFTLTTGANIGYGEDQSISRRAARRDSTLVNSLIQRYEARMNGKVGGLTLNSSVTSDLREGNSTTRQRDSGGSLVDEVKEKTNSHARNLNAEIQWVPAAKIQTTVNSRWAHEVNQYWDFQANDQLGGQESKDGKNIGTSAVIEWTPSETAKFHGEMAKGLTQGAFKLQNKDFKKATVSGRFDGSFRLPSFAGPLRDTDLSAGYNADEARNVLENGVDYRQANRHVRIGAKRKLGSKLQASISEEISLLQYFYEDGSSDRDERRMSTDGVLNYSRSPAFSGYFNFNLGERKAVSIPGAKAINNSTNQSYRVSTQFAYNRGDMRIEQLYTIQADYIYYQFQKDADVLVRINSVLTNFNHVIWRRIRAGLLHEYQFTESGGYIAPQAGRPRAYSPQREETRQMLTLTAGYPFGILRIETRQMFELRRTGEIRQGNAVGNITESRRGELSIRGDLEQKFSNDFNLQASFQKTRSMTEQGYWTVRASVTKGF